MPSRPFERSRHAGLLWLAAAATIAQFLPGTSAARATCDGPIQHPLAVRVVALDPVRRGESVRLRVETTSRAALTAVDVSIVNDGGTTVSGPRRASFGRLQAGRSRHAEFQVSLPAQGERFLVQFKARGEGLNGQVTRGATFNLLPDGPQQPVRVARNLDGEQVAEYAARRIER